MNTLHSGIVNNVGSILRGCETGQDFRFHRTVNDSVFLLNKTKLSFPSLIEINIFSLPFVLNNVILNATFIFFHKSSPFSAYLKSSTTFVPSHLKKKCVSQHLHGLVKGMFTTSMSFTFYLSSLRDKLVSRVLSPPQGRESRWREDPGNEVC